MGSLTDSDDDAPLVVRAKGKDASGAAEVKKEATAAKPGPVKAEVKEEDAPGPKPGPAKAPAKAVKAEVKEEGKKPAAAAKGKPAAKAAVKAEEPAEDGEGKGGAKKAKGDSKPVKEKKEFDMPGQTREPPPETDALRKFYTSLLEQRPDSDMAKRWCLQHGLLSREAAEELVAQIKKGRPAAKSPAKSAAPRSEGKAAAAKTRRPAEKAPAAKKTRQAVSPPKRKKVQYSDEEDEASSSSASEAEDDDDDDEPIGRRGAAKGAAAAAAKPAAKGAGAAGVKKRPLKGKDNAFVDGGLGSDSDDDDKPLIARAAGAKK